MPSRQGVPSLWTNLTRILPSVSPFNSIDRDGFDELVQQNYWPL
jgi:hypothetical protein